MKRRSEQYRTRIYVERSRNTATRRRSRRAEKAIARPGGGDGAERPLKAIASGGGDGTEYPPDHKRGND